MLNDSRALRTWENFFIKLAFAALFALMAYIMLADIRRLSDFAWYGIFGLISTYLALCALADFAALTSGEFMKKIGGMIVNAIGAVLFGGIALFCFQYGNELSEIGKENWIGTVLGWLMLIGVAFFGKETIFDFVELLKKAIHGFTNSLR